MRKEKAPQPVTANSASENEHVESTGSPAARCPTRNPRYLRVLFALLQRIEGISREQLDRIAGTSNSPEVVRRLKKRYDVDIATERIPCRDRDGRPSHFGVYTLEPQERSKVQSWLAAAACPGQ
jgi:hypothetical protein